MENNHAPYDFVVSKDQDLIENEEYTQGDSHNNGHVSIQRTSNIEIPLTARQVQIPNYPEGQENTAYSLVEEDVLETHDEAEQAIPNSNLDYSTQYPTVTSPDNDDDDFVDPQPIQQSATSLGAENSANATKPNASSSFQSDGHWAQNDNNYGAMNGEAGTYIGESEYGNSNDYYRGMDNQWHLSVPPQNLQTRGSSYLAGADQYGAYHKSSAYPRSYTTASPHPRHPFGFGLGSPLEYLHPSDVQIPQQFQRRRHHTANTQTPFISQGPTALNYKTRSRSTHTKSPSRASRLATEVTTSPDQQATLSSQSESGLYSNRPFTDADFFPKIRKGGKLLEDGVTWNMEARKNHYDYWARYHGRPALPKSVKGGPSDFKLRSIAIEALNEADQRSLQDFINAAKYFAVTGNPNRPNNRQAAIDLRSGDEEENEVEAVSRPGKYQVIAPKKRSREEREESDDALVNRRKRTRPNSISRQGNSHPDSQPFTKNPQGQMSFPNMEAANQWLAIIGQPSILEAANSLLANRGVPSIIIENPRPMGLPSNLGYPHVNRGYQRGFVAPFPTEVNGRSVGVQGSGQRGRSRLSGPHKSPTTANHKTATDSKDQSDATQMTGSRVEMPCTVYVGITNMQSSNQGAPLRQQARPKRRREPQQQQAFSPAHTKTQRHSSPVAESLRTSHTASETACPDVNERGVSVHSQSRSMTSGNATDANDPSRYNRYARTTSNQFHSSALFEERNLSHTSAPPSNNGGQSIMESCQTHHSPNERTVGERENQQNIDSNLGVQYQNPGDLNFNHTPANQENLADFDFGLSVVEKDDIGESGSSAPGDNSVLQNMIPAPQNNESAVENNNSVPQSDDDYGWLNQYFDFEKLPEGPFQKEQH